MGRKVVNMSINPISEQLKAGVATFVSVLLGYFQLFDEVLGRSSSCYSRVKEDTNDGIHRAHKRCRDTIWQILESNSVVDDNDLCHQGYDALQVAIDDFIRRILDNLFKLASACNTQVERDRIEHEIRKAKMLSEYSALNIGPKIRKIRECADNSFPAGKRQEARFGSSLEIVFHGGSSVKPQNDSKANKLVSVS
jgi:hypothetical protein